LAAKSSIACALAVAGLAWVTPATAADICQAVAIRDVPALENPSSILRKGQFDEAITQYRIDIRTGQPSFCSHGGYCYPARIQVGGDQLESLRLTNCRMSETPETSFDEGYVVYSVEPIRARIPEAQLQRDDLENAFLRMGLCSACADNVAQYYVSQPNSTCALLAKNALEGNPDSMQALVNDPPFCRWDYDSHRH
jgi:hypothetical protein